MPSAVSPKYDPEVVERTILEEVLELHPRRLTADALLLRIVGDPEDDREVETATDAIRKLGVSGLVRQRDDDQMVTPTQAALRAFELLFA